MEAKNNLNITNDKNVILYAVDNFSEKIKRKSLNLSNINDFLDEIKDITEVISCYFDLNNNEAFIFLISLIHLMENDTFGLSNIKFNISISPPLTLSYRENINILVERRILKEVFTRKGFFEGSIYQKEYKLTQETIYTVMNGTKFTPFFENIENSSEKERIINIINYFMEEQCSDTSQIRGVLMAIFKNMEKFKKNNFAKNLCDFNNFEIYEPLDIYIFLHTILNYIEGEIDNDLNNILYHGGYLIRNGERYRKILLIKEKKFSLYENGWLEFCNDLNGGEKIEMKLTEKALQKLILQDFDRIIPKKVRQTIISEIDPENIEPVNLFYNDKEHEEIDILTNLLSEENLPNVFQRMKNEKMLPGFKILLSGKSGAGKTELVKQICRKSKRALITVDISSIKDMFVGGSEKNCKQIFSIYQKAYNSYQTCPVLLFNECESLISTRIKGGNNHSVNNMLNSMQNIFLQALEDFSGICFLTTNLHENIDSAFFRRMLYKINFRKPSSDVRTKILMDKLSIREEIANKIAVSFELTGGNIENIRTKLLVEKILNNEDNSFDVIEKLCQQELNILTENHNRIGFLK